MYDVLMRPLNFNIISTLVLAAARMTVGIISMAVCINGNAATHTPSPDTPITSASPAPDPTTKQADLSTLSVSPSTIPKEPPAKTIFYSYNQSISPRSGIEYDFFQPHNLSNSAVNYLFGFEYMFASVTSQHWEIGADLMSNSRFYFNGGYKWIFNQFDEFRTFAKVGASLRFDTGASLATFVDYKAYQVRGTFGFEKLFLDPISLRVEIELEAGLDEIAGFLCLGYSWGW